jgi:hypothetical protein
MIESGKSAIEAFADESDIKVFNHLESALSLQCATFNLLSACLNRPYRKAQAFTFTDQESSDLFRYQIEESATGRRLSSRMDDVNVNSASLQVPLLKAKARDRER